MKRLAQLQPLSRQHHNGLLAALLLKKGIAKGASINIMSAFILDLWNNDLNEHFKNEEMFLVPALKKTVFDETLSQKLLHEHNQIRSYIATIQKGLATIPTIQSFANLLELHIRFEERIYFNEAEKALSELQLQSIGLRLHETKENNCIHFPVKFWE